MYRLTVSISDFIRDDTSNSAKLIRTIFVMEAILRRQQQIDLIELQNRGFLIQMRDITEADKLAQELSVNAFVNLQGDYNDNHGEK